MQNPFVSTVVAPSIRNYVSRDDFSFCECAVETGVMAGKSMKITDHQPPKIEILENLHRITSMFTIVDVYCEFVFAQGIFRY